MKWLFTQQLSKHRNFVQINFERLRFQPHHFKNQPSLVKANVAKKYHFLNPSEFLQITNKGSSEVPRTFTTLKLIIETLEINQVKLFLTHPGLIF